LIVNHAIFARRGAPKVGSLEELRGHPVALHRGGIMDDKLSRLGLEQLLRTSTPADALRLVASGQLDYAVVAVVPGTYLLKELKLTNVEPVAQNVATVRYGYAVRKGNSELLGRLTEGLAILKKTGRYEEIHERWLGVLEPRGISLEVVLRWSALVGLPLLAVLGGTVLWSRSLKVQVAQRTESLAREVAQRERTMEQLRLHQEQLVQADKMAALGVLVSGVAHEVNNPNGLILLNTPTLKEAWLDAVDVLDAHAAQDAGFTLAGIGYERMREEIPRLLDEMLDGGRQIKRIVEDLKDFARREDAGHFDAIDLNPVVKAAIRLVDASIKKATWCFSATYADDLPRVLGNAQRIEQVVVNLILNACQALPAPTRVITVTTRHDEEGDAVVLEVKDEGVGIPEEHLARLTDPFFTTKRESGGTGLGLSVSAGIVKEHRGTLTFRSAPGEGTTAIFSLPAIHEESAA
jgi:polar amino acid transport system substrate-binding protein